MNYFIAVLLSYIAFLLWNVSKKMHESPGQSFESFSPFFDALSSAKKQVDFLMNLQKKTWDDLQGLSGEQAEAKEKELAVVYEELRTAKECLEAILEANYKVTNGQWSFVEAKRALKEWRDMQFTKMSKEQAAKNLGRSFPSDLI